MHQLNTLSGKFESGKMWFPYEAALTHHMFIDTKAGETPI